MKYVIINCSYSIDKAKKNDEEIIQKIEYSFDLETGRFENLPDRA